MGHSGRKANTQASRSYKLDQVFSLVCYHGRLRDCDISIYPGLPSKYLTSSKVFFRRSLRKVGDTIVSGSDDWTARLWSVSRGACDAVLYCHKGAVTCVDYCAADHGIITGK